MPLRQNDRAGAHLKGPVEVLTAAAWACAKIRKTATNPQKRDEAVLQIRQVANRLDDLADELEQSR